MDVPRMAALLLRILLPEALRDDVLRTLELGFTDLAARSGVGRARRWYWSQALRSAWPALRARTRGGDGLAQDLRYALGQLRRAPGLAATVIVTLALGIGANSAIFSVVSGVMLRPLPFDESERLVYINTYFHPESGYDFSEYAVGSPEYFDFQDQVRSVEEVAAISTEPVTITDGVGDPELVRAGWVSPSMFAVLRTPPLLGRVLLDADGGAEPARVVVLEHDFWQRRFGGDSTVVGRTIDLGMQVFDDPLPAEVVGVMPPGFTFPDGSIQLWGPLPLDRARTSRGGHWFTMIGRLAQGVTLERARAEIGDLNAGLARDHPDHHVGHGFFMDPLLDQVVGEAGSSLILLQGAVLFVLLIACANVASLLMARGEGRRREVAVRAALGARRLRLVRQLLVESLVLATLGGALGLALAFAGLDLLMAMQAGSLPRADGVGIDASVLLFTSASVVVSTVAFGAWPAIGESSTNLAAAFKEAARTSSASRRQMRVRKVVVGSQIALSLVLVVGAGLMVKSFDRLLSEEPGFRTDNLAFSRLSLPASDYPAEESVAFFEELARRIRTVPGVVGASIMSRPPMLWKDQAGRFHIVGRPEAASGPLCCVGSSVAVGSGVHRLLGVPLVRGRLFTEEDQRPESPPVAIVDEEAARRYWPGGDPIGERLRYGRDDSSFITVVGVVGNVTYDGPGEVFPHVYNIVRQQPDEALHATYLVTRASDESVEVSRIVRGILREMDPGLALAGTYDMAGIESRAVARPRFIMSLLGVFAAVALLLGAVGVYGIMSHTVAQRVDEIGVRRALGAEEGDLAWMVIRQSLVVALGGVAVGLVGAAVASRVLTGFLHDVSPTDPWTFGGVALGVTAVAVLASWIPARRARRIDPAVALRQE